MERIRQIKMAWISSRPVFLIGPRGPGLGARPQGGGLHLLNGPLKNIRGGKQNEIINRKRKRGNKETRNRQEKKTKDERKMTIK